MWIIYGLLIEGDVCTSWIKIILFLAIWFAQVQLYLAYSMAGYLLSLTTKEHLDRWLKSMCKCMLHLDQYLQEHKEAFMIINGFIAVTIITVFIVVPCSDIGAYILCLCDPHNFCVTNLHHYCLHVSYNMCSSLQSET